MNLTIDTTELQRVIQPLQDAPRQARFAAALGLTRTAQRLLEAERSEMQDVFDRPTPWTMNALFLRRATPSNLEAVVSIKDNSFSGRPAISWLRWQVYGGLRTQTAFEKLLTRAGAMRDDQRMVPGRFARLDAFGNISRGQLVQILSQLRIDTTIGSTRSLPRITTADNKVDRRRKAGVIRRAYQRAGGQYVAFPNGRGKLRPGIYQVRQFAAGRADPKPVLIFVTKAEYEEGRFDFHYVAELAIQRHLVPEVQAAVQQTLLTARPGGAAA